jgi:hypothetical protein
MIDFSMTLLLSVVLTLWANFLVGSLFLRPMGRRIGRRRRASAQAGGH